MAVCGVAPSHPPEREEAPVRTRPNERVMSWSECFQDLRAVFADDDLRTWCAIGGIVIIQSLWALFTGDFVWGMLTTWTGAIFLQMLFEKKPRPARR